MEEENFGGNKEEEKSITIKKSDLWKYSTFLLVAVVLIGAFFMFTGNGTPTGNVVQQPTQQEPTTASAKVDDDAVLGNKDAPITIIEFSDYQCPYCGRHFVETFPQLKKDYIDTGKVKLVFRDFPLTQIHPMAQPSAEAAECVREKGGDDAYWKMHDKLFENQATLSIDSIKSMAKDLGYDVSSCLDSGKYKNEVLKDSADAQTAGYQGTPGFLIMKSGETEGIPLKGAYPYDTFKQIIDSLA